MFMQKVCCLPLTHSLNIEQVPILNAMLKQNIQSLSISIYLLNITSTEIIYAFIYSFVEGVFVFQQPQQLSFC